jgi:hypothetical protein
MGSREQAPKTDGTDVSEAQLGTLKAEAPPLDRLLAKWQAAIARLRGEQNNCSTTNPKAAARLGHRIEVYTRCADELETALGAEGEARRRVPRHSFALRSLIVQIPHGTAYHANRYDTDDEHVLKVWDDAGHSYDLRLPKSRADDRTPTRFTALEKLLLALDARLLKDGGDSDDPLRKDIADALRAENLRILDELDETAPLVRSSAPPQPEDNEGTQ